MSDPRKHDTLDREAAMRRAVNTVKCGVVAYVLGDNDGLRDLVHPECVWRFPGDPTILPWAGVYHGMEIIDFFERVKDSIFLTDHIPHTFIAIDENRVLLKTRDVARVKATGRVFDHELLTLVTLRDGLLIEWDEHGDTGAMERAFYDVAEQAL